MNFISESIGQYVACNGTNIYIFAWISIQIRHFFLVYCVHFARMREKIRKNHSSNKSFFIFVEPSIFV